ncbi:MAG TPA: hypothetical protein VIV60_34780, partial [Polyangiaceae bacterium]
LTCPSPSDLLHCTFPFPAYVPKRHIEPDVGRPSYASFTPLQSEMGSRACSNTPLAVDPDGIARQCR